MHLGKVRSKAAESQVITNMTTKMTKMTKMQIAKAFVGTCCRSPELTTVSPPFAASRKKLHRGDHHRDEDHHEHSHDHLFQSKRRTFLYSWSFFSKIILEFFCCLIWPALCVFSGNNQKPQIPDAHLLSVLPKSKCQ